MKPGVISEYFSAPSLCDGAISHEIGGFVFFKGVGICALSQALPQD
jgi:hypothetical protein